jgi:glycerol-3-phosphate acyltransferase PlsY
MAGAYLLGSIPFGLVLCKLSGKIDPRTAGSKNIGATNVTRLAGKPIGVATLLLDVAKGAVPVFLAAAWLPDWQCAFIGLAAFFGHCYSIYFGFKGGKGVATAMGVYLALSWPSLLGVLAVFIAATWRSGHVSLGSILACCSAPLWILAWGGPWPVAAVAVVMAAIVVWKHRENIARLRAGTEHGLGSS